MRAWGPICFFVSVWCVCFGAFSSRHSHTCTYLVAARVSAALEAVPLAPNQCRVVGDLDVLGLAVAKELGLIVCG